jgi:hypothetical protein
MSKPPWAFSIWCDANHIFAELPAVNGLLSHMVKVPNNKAGLAKLLVLAKSRGPTSKIGEKGDPTQFQIEKITYDPAMIRKVGRIKPKFSIDQKATTREVLRKLGLLCLALLLCACQMPLR